MKKIFTFLLFISIALSLSAQNKTVVKLRIEPPSPFGATLSGTPQSVNDNSLFEVGGGTEPYTYQWERTKTDPGYTHIVTVGDANNCTSAIYVNIENFDDTSVEEIQLSNSVHPNPVLDIANIPLPAGEESVEIMVIDVNGRLLSKSVVASGGQYYSLSLAKCPSGKYFIQVGGSTAKTYIVIKK